MAGRRPKPTMIKKLAGNPGKRALNEREPRAPIKLPACPKWLTVEAKREYRRVGRLLVKMGVMMEIDRAALAGYAQAWARWMEAEEEMARPGFRMIRETDKGYQHASPWLSVSNQAQKLMRGYLVEFGMTPATRSRVQAADTEGEMSLADLLFSSVTEDHE